MAYIVPAFETFNTQLDFPSTKEELLQQIASEAVKPFRIDVWQAGHLATNYSHWYSANTTYSVGIIVQEAILQVGIQLCFLINDAIYFNKPY